MKDLISVRILGLVIVVAVLAMIALQVFVVREPISAPAVFSADSPVADQGFDTLPQPAVIPNEKHSSALEFFDYPLLAEFNNEVPPVIEGVAQGPSSQQNRYSLRNADSDSPARIAIVIDDMGMNKRYSKAMADIKGVPMTLAYLPYANGLDDMTAHAAANGHELMIHMPMEPMDGTIDTGPIALMDAMSRADIDAMLEKAYASFDGYKGLNNHMGSRLTQNSEAMGWVMDSLEEQGLFYLDSKTIGSSIAADMARKQGIDYAERDVFLDHEGSIAFVRNALKKLERVAIQDGHAIAIGHPKGVTYDGLIEWIPTLEARGFEIVPVSELMLQKVSGDVGNLKIAKVEKAAKVAKTVLPDDVVTDSSSASVSISIEPAAGDVTPIDSDSIEALLNAPVTDYSSDGLYNLQLEPLAQQPK